METVSCIDSVAFVCFTDPPVGVSQQRYQPPKMDQPRTAGVEVSFIGWLKPVSSTLPKKTCGYYV